MVVAGLVFGVPPRLLQKKNINIDLSGVSRLIPYTGGKNRYAKKLVPLFPTYKCYVEPFCGSLAVLFNKPKTKTEVVNDLDSELINFYRIIRENSQEFKRMIHFTPYSREVYNTLIESKEYKTQLEKAWKFYAIKRMGWTNKPSKDSIRVDTKGGDASLFHQLEELLWAFADRLNNVFLECKPYDHVIRQWDRDYTFFYCDPPYLNSEKMYEKGDFSKKDHEKLAYTLKNIKGKAMISYYENKWLDSLYKGWNKKTFSIKSRQGKDTKTEVIYFNYKINKQLSLFGEAD